MKTTSLAPRVAILGASGIGKNHARWFHRHGADVVAFLGSSAASVAATQQILMDGFGFDGRGYDDLAILLEGEQPDIICVSSPPPLHFAHVLSSIAAGAHVLCEKPLVYDPDLSGKTLIEQAHALVGAADEAKVLLGTQMQYAVAVSSLLELSGHYSPSAVRHFALEMETKNLKHGRDFERIWIDLSPHPLSVLQILSGGQAQIDPSSIRCEVRQMETEARFQLSSGLEAHITVRFNPDNPTPLRRFTLDGHDIHYSGRKDEHGEFWTYLTASDGREIRLPDFVDSLVANFLGAARGEEKFVVSGEMGAQNVAWQWQILAAANRLH